VSAGFFNKLRLSWIRRQTGGADRIGDWQSIDGWLSPNEAMGLYHVAGRLPASASVVEIGSWKGKSTFCIARGLKSGTIQAIDPFDASGDAPSAEVYSQKRGELPLVEQFRQNLRTRGMLEKIFVHPGYSHQFVGQFKEVDFLFIDGDHSIEGCRFDFEKFSPAVKPGGFLAFHDYDHRRDDLGPTWVVKQQVLPGGNFRFYAQFDSLWVGRRTS
jgi:hypothetical protein